ncbi:reverse transcriptase/maturase family protein [Synechococcus sp. PCC 7335]|uniref:reverse transcriptase/maturase family protein n=1 Tax=Synechococcus sp. (strain ATCC 29403 / PCC 7335) TaxID=91464 RepID=UPI000571AF5A|nr:reverse transcriptase/maturase family protein [Synechococcus sp. PCC 7335]
MSGLIGRIASDEVIDRAYAWLSNARKDYHHNNDDVWQVRRWWTQKKPILQAQLLAGTYRFQEQRLIRGKERIVELWCAMDALVLKAMAIVLGEVLRPHLSERVFHLAGSGGMKAAVREVARNVAKNVFVFRTDVKGYYACIDQGILYGQVAGYVDDEKVLGLVGQYLARFVSDGGEYVDISQGISLGCPLSPLMGALYLKPLDDAMAKLGCFYVRFMDDWVVLSRTRWRLRRAIRVVNGVMNVLRVVKHPEKTFIGRVARGFEFLGYWFSGEG